MTGRLFSVLLVVSLLPTWLFAEDFVNVGAIEDVPPYSYVENNRFKGIDYEILLSLAQRMKFKTKFALFPARRVYQYAKEGTLDLMLQLYYNPAREKDFIYSKEPIRWSAHYIFVRADTIHDYSCCNIQALSGRTVGKNAWYFISHEFNQAADQGKFIVEEATTTVANLQKLLEGRIDCYVSAYHVAMSNIKQLNLGGKIVHLSEPIIAHKGVYIGLSKKSKNVADKNIFIQQINTVLKEMHTDGTIARIENTYLK